MSKYDYDVDSHLAIMISYSNRSIQVTLAKGPEMLAFTKAIFSVRVGTHAPHMSCHVRTWQS